MNTQVSDTQGHVYAGAGNQYNFGPLSLIDAKGRDPRRQAADELLWLRRLFVYPPGFGRARQVLEDHRTVFLDAPPGSGRITAARMLLWELTGDAQRFHELIVQEPERPRRVNLSHIGDDDRVWLDLSGVDETSWGTIHSELSEVRRTIQDHLAHLVVVLPHPPHGLKPELGPFHVKIERPSLDEVFQRCLRVHGLERGAQLPVRKLGNDPGALEQIPKFVGLIVEARDKDLGQGDFTNWYKSAVEALSGHEKSVADEVRALEEGPQRALLLATALLHGAHADSVHEAATTLMAAAGQPLDDSPVLERATLDSRLEAIDAELDPQGRVRFRKIDYAPAVRAYCWTHIPELREHITAWVGGLAGSSRLDANERDDLVQRFTRQCLDERHRSTLATLIERWTSDSPSPSRTRAAAVVLVHALRDQSQGRFFRRQIYFWSRRNDLPGPLAELIVVACRDELAISHPDEAVVRLHHRARREHAPHRAREALIALVGQDRRFLRQMLQRLTEPSSGRGHSSVDTDLFLELADPQKLTTPGANGRPLITLRTVHEQLHMGWTSAFARSTHEPWMPLAWRWLDLAASHPRHQDTLLDLMIAAGTPQTRVLARLYSMALRPDLRPLLGDLVLRKINAAQGIPCGRLM